jgi:uncharacterized protein
MVPLAIVRQYATGQQIAYEVADQEIVLHYALRLLSDAGLVGRPRPDTEPGALLFKGGTALRKCVFGNTGRFSQDIDLDATHQNGFEAEIERAFAEQTPFHGIAFSIPAFRYSEEGNFSGTVAYRHEQRGGRFELQISYRLHPILDSRDLVLQEQPYFARVEFDPPLLRGLDPYEMVGEKIMACHRRLGGSAKDIYDLFLWASRPFSTELVRRLAVLKAWTDQRARRPYRPDAFLTQIEPRRFRWEDIRGLVPRRLESDPARICAMVRERFSFLADCSEEEQTILDDQAAHRERRLFNGLRAEARQQTANVPR